ncbi:helix-turn-helix transcriptional regulator [Martelella lutilitoris]|uniref:Helix-turn-helix transcriptional regulator n=1 Tax=Martelella lutilitoris TaxID=2583532 RepID=A0A7T7HP29_9HYPH|nr:helix-turn-helix transcriptional regulator [Martelella lutilitoris]QQM32786.1 helix-turn-helix transcriptional regulator [Martelella lutilitoris]
MRQEQLMPLPDPDWIETLRAEAEKPGRTKAAIAKELGISRPAVSLICAGKYTARLNKVGVKIAAKVMALYGRKVWCAHLRTSISNDQCRENHNAPMTMSDPVRLKQWAACHACPLNPKNMEEESHAVGHDARSPKDIPGRSGNDHHPAHLRNGGT